MSFLSAIDQVAPAYSITFQGQETLKTKMGSLLSLGLMACVIISSVVFIRDYMDTSNLTVTTSEDFLEKKYVFNVAENGMLPIFFVHSYDLNGPLPATELLDRFSFILGTTKIDTDTNNRLTFDNTLNMGVPCKDLDKDQKAYNYVAKASNYEEIKDKVHKYGICFKLEKTDPIFVRGFGNEKNDQRLSIRVGPCVGRTDCRLEDYFNFELHTAFPTFVTNLYNKDKPYEMKFNLDDHIRTWSWKGYNMYRVKASMRTITDAPRMSGESQEVARYPQVIEIKDSSYSRNTDGSGNLVFEGCETHRFIWDSCQGFLKIDYMFLPSVTKFHRTLPKFADLLSEIGGISSLLFTVFVYANSFYLFFMKDRIMTNRLFPLLKNTKNNQQKVNIRALRKQAAKVVELTFDFHELFQELSCLKLLTKAMLTEDQKKAAGLIPLYEQLQLESDSKQEGGQNQQSRKKTKKSQVGFESIEEASSLFKEKVQSPPLNKSPAISFESIKQQIDKMVLESIQGLGLLNQVNSDSIRDRAVYSSSVQNHPVSNFQG